MWSYYGRKSKIVHHYPKPLYKTIIEPFAGTAVYSLYQDNWKRQIILVEKDILIIRLWKYLQQASSKDIMDLPDVKAGDDLRKHTFLSEEERWLMGYWLRRGDAYPALTVSPWGGDNLYWKDKREIISSDLYKIRHWEVIPGSYEICADWEATWYIDPPYQYGGERYRCSSKELDFSSLGNWCMSRQGQIIVCENSKADWLPFIPLVNMRGSQHTTLECIYTN